MLGAVVIDSEVVHGADRRGRVRKIQHRISEPIRRRVAIHPTTAI